MSRLFIYYVGRKVDQNSCPSYFGDPAKAPTDSGMTLSGAIEAMEIKGACLQATYPFDLSKVNKMPPADAFSEARGFKVERYATAPY